VLARLTNFLIIGLDDPLHQRVTNNIPRLKMGHANLIDTAQQPHRMA
jgi:hypothetical protein